MLNAFEIVQGASQGFTRTFGTFPRKITHLRVLQNATSHIFQFIRWQFKLRRANIFYKGNFPELANLNMQTMESNLILSAMPFSMSMWKISQDVHPIISLNLIGKYLVNIYSSVTSLQVLVVLCKFRNIKYYSFI